MLLVFGMTRLDLSLPVLDHVRMESLPFLQSLSCFDFLSLLYGLSRLGDTVFVLDFGHFGSSLLTRGIGSALSVYGMSRLDSTLPVLDFIHLDLLLSLQSYIHLGFASLIYGMA